MEYSTTSLFAVAVLNAVFSYFILMGKKNTMNILFSLVALFVSLWSLTIAFFFNANNPNSALLWANFYYIFAASIPLLFFYFSLVFPKKNKKVKKIYYIFVIPFILLILALLLDENFVIQNISIDDWGKNIQLNKLGYLSYSSYFIVFILMSYVEFLLSYKKTSNIIEKKQILFVVSGTLLSYILGIIFNLILPWLGTYKFIWLGPVFSLIMVISIGYAIIKHNLFNIKIIATELFTFAIWISVFLEVLSADTLKSAILETWILIAVIIFGILIIRSVKREIKTREEVEKLAKNLEKANMRLRELDKQKSEFVSIASHQLRSPLTAISGYASMMLDGSFGKIPEEMMKPIGNIFESSKQLVYIIEDFLDVTRIEQGRMEYDFTKVSIKDLIEDIISELTPTIKKLGLKIDFTTDSDLYYVVQADKSKINQVFTNLIDNAMKYTPNGSINIKISKDVPIKKIIVSIKDTGIGFSKKMQDRLFGKFNRGENGRRLHTNGSGIGLYVAKEIVKGHKGKIWAESDGENKGATFFVELSAV